VARSRSTKSASTSTAKLRQFLLRQDLGWLVDQLLQIAENDPLVTAHLQVESGADRTGLVDLSGLRHDLPATAHCGTSSPTVDSPVRPAKGLITKAEDPLAVSVAAPNDPLTPRYSRIAAAERVSQAAPYALVKPRAR
jgi:hypothetical protein